MLKGMSISSCTAMTWSGAISKKLHSPATGPPETFMYVMGLASTTRGPPMPSRPSTTWARALWTLNFPPMREASSSSTIWPTLCRLLLYSLPGLPRPTISQVSVMVSS
ncbi:hypothetical protein D3C73_1373210 [compost metagenome]